MAIIIDQSVYLEIDSAPLAVRGVVRVLRIQRLLNLVTRGENRTVAGEPGDEAYPREIAALAVQLPICVYGWRDYATGAKNADPFAGVVTNLLHYRSVLAPPDAPDATLAAVLYLGPIAETAVAEIQVVSLEFGDESGPTVEGTLELIVPAGGFVAGGS